MSKDSVLCVQDCRDMVFQDQVALGRQNIIIPPALVRTVALFIDVHFISSLRSKIRSWSRARYAPEYHKAATFYRACASVRSVYGRHLHPSGENNVVFALYADDSAYLVSSCRVDMAAAKL
ncbi:hypothetical protein EVAR_22831_1 [Eumeta japonica]|uniref:Uncharacterized protein n=1 Tax=Eumeta variegata TaxID=151549 RepID=A0A4C1VFF7_EUMVA|nr:hypothetical protein EVAR_22831_1 [Eumeta japonica]